MSNNKGPWAIIEEDTQLVDGWYSRHPDALGMLDFYNKERPNHARKLIKWGEEGTENCRELIAEGKSLGAVVVNKHA